MSTFITVYNRSVRLETKDQTLVDLIVEFLKNFYTVVPKEEFPNSSANKIKEELEKAGYNTDHGPLDTLVITW